MHLGVSPPPDTSFTDVDTSSSTEPVSTSTGFESDLVEVEGGEPSLEIGLGSRDTDWTFDESLLSADFGVGKDTVIDVQIVAFPSAPAVSPASPTTPPLRHQHRHHQASPATLRPSSTTTFAIPTVTTAPTRPTTTPTLPIKHPTLKSTRFPVSLDPRPIVIPMVTTMVTFPIFALAVICALRYRAKRARQRSQLVRSNATRNGVGGSRTHYSTRLKVVREPPTFTELSVIGTSGEEAKTIFNANCPPSHSHRHHHSRRGSNSPRGGLLPTGAGNRRKASSITVSGGSIGGGSSEKDGDEDDDGEARRVSTIRYCLDSPTRESLDYSEPGSPLDVLTGKQELQFTFVIEEDC